ncbi:collagen and calcium-binding EGF domain-containing protein 1-like isoform X4 [Heterodontus francisci]|uniref:collagen and calcium-binding EGF domain-containing protein 1-like isoform X4 n=1 Tax=Heterodontus francisci TaxID=7792 RepID=UPI00355C0CE4
MNCGEHFGMILAFTLLSSTCPSSVLRAELESEVCPENHVVTLEYQCTKATGETSTCLRKKCCEGYRFVLGQCFPEDTDVCAGSPCEQQCTDNFGRVVCTCYPGYRFDRERHRNHRTPYCLDVDECLVNNGTLCDHKCVNTLGSYICECQEGFYLSTDGKSCLRAFNDSSAIKSEHLMSSGTCSVTCEEFLQMKQTLAQLKQKLLFTNLDNSSEKTQLARKCTETLQCPPHLPGLPGAPGPPVAAIHPPIDNYAGNDGSDQALNPKNTYTKEWQNIITEEVHQEIQALKAALGQWDLQEPLAHADPEVTWAPWVPSLINPTSREEDEVRWVHLGHQERMDKRATGVIQDHVDYQALLDHLTSSY